MSDSECVFGIALMLITGIVIFTAFSVTTEMNISIDVDNAEVGEHFHCDIVFSSVDFDSCNIDITVSNHLGIGNYSVMSGEKFGNETVLDLSIENLSVKSLEDITGSFVLLRLDIIPYHAGNATIEVKVNEKDNEKCSINEKDNIEIINKTKINISKNEENDIFRFSVNETKQNATYKWTLSKKSHTFFSGKNMTTYVLDGDYLLTVSETISENTSSSTTKLSYNDGILDSLNFYKPHYIDNEEKGENDFFLVFIIIASIVGSIVAYVIYKFFT